MILDVVCKGKKSLEQKLIQFGVISVGIYYQLNPRSATGWSINYIIMNRGSRGSFQVITVLHIGWSAKCLQYYIVVIKQIVTVSHEYGGAISDFFR